MFEEQENLDFAKRCKNFEQLIFTLQIFEESQKVWTVVLVTILKELINKQNNPNKALEQVIYILRNE